jgi:glycosyltransferase involved in cell wall biosynthesis
VINEKIISVIVPAFNEELLIKKTINSIPSSVEKIIIINDCSSDK